MADLVAQNATQESINEHLVIRVKSSNGRIFSTTLKIARSSKIIDDMIKNLDMGNHNWNDEPLSLTQVHSSILEKIIEFGEHYTGQVDPRVSEEGILSNWDEKFWSDLNDEAVDMRKMIDVLSAGHFLEMDILLNSGCQFIANMFKGKEPQEIRDFFGIPNDFSAEENAKLTEESQWFFQ